MILGGRSGCTVMRDEAGQPGDATGARRAAGELEAGVLAVLQAAGRPLPPGEVRERVGGGLAPTPGGTVLARLPAKGGPPGPQARRGTVDGPGAAPAARAPPPAGRGPDARRPAG